jgi:hypothetical protein
MAGFMRDMRARLLVLFATFTAIMMLVGCSKDDDTKPEEGPGNQHIHGNVSYKNRPVPYGFVLVYRFREGPEAMKKDYTPAASAAISDGKYDITDAPSGRVRIAIATDPDLMPAEFFAPTVLSAIKGNMPGGPGGKQPGKGESEPPPGQGGKDKVLKHPGKDKSLTPPGWVNPAVATLSESEKQTLREIHSHFGTPAKSHITLDLNEGDKKLDLELK